MCAGQRMSADLHGVGVNDTGAAMGRLLIAIMDNYQQSDGSVKVPEVLQGVVGKDLLTPQK